GTKLAFLPVVFPDCTAAVLSLRLPLESGLKLKLIVGKTFRGLRRTKGTL
ncbi:hypothetical protein LINPERHAP1_LOCUS1989, partial [Linum perenne]